VPDILFLRQSGARYFISQTVWCQIFYFSEVGCQIFYFSDSLVPDIPKAPSFCNIPAFVAGWLAVRRRESAPSPLPLLIANVLKWLSMPDD
jgi:hypothetical protein